MSKGMEIGGIALGISGWIFSIVACALPMWCGTVFVNANIVPDERIWQGLWMNCVVQSTREIICKVYNSILALPQEIQASRAMMVIVIVLASWAWWSTSVVLNRGARTLSRGGASRLQDGRKINLKKKNLLFFFYH